MSMLATLLGQAYAQQQQGMSVAMPGQILKYDAANQKASVQPLLDRSLTTGEVETMPVLNDVPVIWPRSGGASMTFPVKPGDGCLLIFMDRSIDGWKEEGGSHAPNDPRAHALSDAVAIMGFVSFKAAGGPDDRVRIILGSSTVDITENSVEITTGEVTVNSDSATVNADQVEVNASSMTVNAPTSTFQGNVAIAGNLGVIGDMNSQGPLNITGPSVTHNGTNIGSSHKHSGVQTGGGSTGGPS